MPPAQLLGHIDAVGPDEVVDVKLAASDHAPLGRAELGLPCPEPLLLVEAHLERRTLGKSAALLLQMLRAPGEVGNALVAVGDALVAVGDALVAVGDALVAARDRAQTSEGRAQELARPPAERDRGTVRDPERAVARVEQVVGGLIQPLGPAGAVLLGVEQPAALPFATAFVIGVCARACGRR